MDEKWKNLKIVDKLKKENIRLYKFVSDHCKRIKKELDEIPNVFSEYTDHSSQHSLKVLKLGDKLIGKNNLNIWEIAIFILSAYYHDIGMYLKSDELNSRISSTKFKKIYPYLYKNIIYINQLKNSSESILKQFIHLEYIRRIHGEISYERITKNYTTDKKTSFFNCNIYLWEAVACVCRSHCMEMKKLKNPPFDIEYFIGDGITVNLLFVACLLRLSDICHLSRDRALPYIRKSIEFYSEKSFAIWKAYGDVADTLPSNEGECIKISASCSDYRIHRALFENAKDIENELVQEHKILHEKKSNYKFPWKFVDTSNVIESPNATYSYSGDHFKLDFDKITELLMGSRLYRYDFFALRECIQNSIDAISMYKLKDKGTSSYIFIQYSTDKFSDHPTLDLYDSGTGMDEDICSNYLLSVGTRSFWFSERSYEDWGKLNKDSNIIASHGIGFLSNFLIADKIEVFSKYQKGQEPIHMEIDSFRTGVIYRKTDISQFPNWGYIKNKYSPPWDMGHGTCIRLHLRESFSKKEVLHFLSSHILRISVPVIFKYKDEAVSLPQVWFFNSFNTGYDRSTEQSELRLGITNLTNTSTNLEKRFI